LLGKWSLKGFLAVSGSFDVLLHDARQPIPCPLCTLAQVGEPEQHRHKVRLAALHRTTQGPKAHPLVHWLSFLQARNGKLLVGELLRVVVNGPEQAAEQPPVPPLRFDCQQSAASSRTSSSRGTSTSKTSGVGIASATEKGG